MFNYSGQQMRNQAVMRRDPIFAMSDRTYLIFDHLQYLKNSESSGLVGGYVDVQINAAAPVNAPNGSYPISPLEKERMLSIQDIVNAGPGFVHKEKFLLCRLMLPAGRLTSLNIVVDDPAGERALRVGLYNFSKNIKSGTVLAIMHPWFKMAADLGAWIRVENPMHVHIFDENEPLLQGIIWKAPLPKYGSGQETEAPVRKDESVQEKKVEDDPALEGNGYFMKKDFKKALEFVFGGD